MTIRPELNTTLWIILNPTTLKINYGFISPLKQTLRNEFVSVTLGTNNWERFSSIIKPFT